MGTDDLGEAISAAVTATHSQAMALLGLLEDVTDVLANPAGPSDAEREADVVAREIAAGISGIARGRLDHLAAFNIVVFGRTGVGKSTLIEALAGGDGARISRDGRINNTVRAEPVRWHDCLLWDVPGIDGEDGQADTAALELEAEQAVAIADVVLLCFDTSSQEAKSFEKIAGWIADYGKPAIVVLNVRSPVWRYPAHPYYRRMHARLCRSNDQHASHIQEELAGIGMTGMPFITVHSSDAAYARAALPWQGPWPDALDRRRGSAGGAETLRTWSNLPALGQLLIAALSGEGASALRLGSLIRQADGALEAGAGLLAAAETADRARAEQAERGIERLLALLGAPEAVLGDAPDHRRVHRLLAELERLRGGALAAPVIGQAVQYADTKIVTAFAGLRAEAHVRADGVIDAAMTARRRVSDDDFAEQVFRVSEMNGAAARVRQEMISYLDQRVSGTFGDMARDLAAVAAELERATVEGSAGKGWRRTSWTAKVLGTVVNIGAGAVALSNPIGLIVIAGTLINVVGIALGWFSGRRAARRREAALATARADARRAVDDAFDDIEEKTAADARQLIASVFAAAVGQVARQAVAWRHAADASAARRRRLAVARTGLPAVADSADLLRDAMRRCERRVATAVPGLDLRAAGRYLWMGESYLADPALADAGTEPGQGAGRPARPAAPGRGGLGDRIRTAVAGPFAVPRAGAGQRWLTDARRRLAGDPDAASMLAQLSTMAASRVPRVLLAGGYNTGKSSFIRRLLVESGQEPPASLQVSATVATQVVTAYDWHGLALVDVPGFQGGDAAHEQEAFTQTRDATAVIYLLGQRLSGLDDLVRVLAGDPDEGIVAKSGRTLIVLNRCDEIGPDPALMPAEHAQACRAKRAETARAVTARAAQLGRPMDPFDPDHILCTASAPYGDAGDSPGDFDPYRPWDGFGDLQRVLLGLRAQLMANGTDVTVLHGGIGRLQELITRGNQRARALQVQAAQLRSLRGDASDALGAGQAISRSRVDRLARQAGDYLEGQLNRALLSKDAELRRLTMTRLEHWTRADEIAAIAASWHGESAREIALWQDRTGQAIGRRLESRAFQGALGHDLGLVPLGFLRSGTRTGTKAAAQASERIGHALKAVDEPTVTILASWASGVLLTEESAATAIRWATRAGASLQLAAGVAQVALLIMDYRSGLDSDAQLRAAGRLLREQAAQWARLVALGGEGGLGLLGGLTARCAELQHDIGELDQRAAALDREITELATRATSYEQLISAAAARLRIRHDQQEEYR